MLSRIVIVLCGLFTAVCCNIVVYTQTIPYMIMEEFRDIPASFGEELPPEGIRGYLVEGVPADGCTALEAPPIVEGYDGKWIVLVARYNCSFEIKIRNAQAAGFDCAIVHNVNSSDLEKMSAKNPDGIVIPSVFVTDVAGDALAAEYQYKDGFFIMVNGDLPFNINTHLLLPFAIVVVLCLIVIFIFMIVKCIKDRRRARRHRLPHRALSKIPTCKFSKGDPYDTCAICLDDYQDGDKLRVLPCAHAYHSACIDPWLTQNKRVCPVCKRRVISAGEPRPRRTSSSDDDSDTEPLLPQQQEQTGGTFEEQRENPFVRAARFMSRLRARNNQNDTDAEIPPQLGDSQETIDEDDVIDTQGVQPLLEGRAPHSINGSSRGEIGVAALPAPTSNSLPRYIDL